ncbi:MAG: tetratricopeptide repeat protein [Candidatus Scalindua sp.]|jgi:outer membrane protein assembly factor BamD (BamD/ComL family)|nr:tetratricopeptide repeat protein [Candidatus Scalindua sp.]
MTGFSPWHKFATYNKLQNPMENVKVRLHHFFQFFSDNKLWIAIGVAVAVAAGVPSYLYQQKGANDLGEVWSRIYRMNYEVATAQQGGSEKKREALEGAISEYTFLKDNLSATGATPWLLSELGNAQYNVKKYDDAILTYREFINRYGNHPLTPVIRQSLGYVLEEKEQLKEAIEQFDMIAEDPEAIYLKAQVRLDVGRCYEKLEQLDLAVATYKDVIGTFPESGYAKMAKYRLEDLE